MRPFFALGVALCLAAPAYAQTPLATWSFDEGTGCLADAALPGTLGPDCPTNAPQWTPGIAGTALRFDGADDAVTIPHTPALASLRAFTLAAWIQHDPTSGYRAILDQRDGGTDGMDLFLNPTGRLYLRANTFTLASHSVVADGTWHHVVGVYDGAAFALYIDGVLDRRAAVGATVIDTEAPLYIGRHYGGNGYTFDGAIDEAAIYGEALDAAAVLALYHSLEQPIHTALLGDWPLDDGNGCTAADATGQHPGSLAPDCPNAGPTWVPGKDGGALLFGDPSDAVLVPHTAAFSPLGQVTMAAWIQHAPTATYRAIMDKRDAGADGFDLYLDPNARLFLRINQHTLASPTPVADGTWHHVAGTYDGDVLRLYMDGALVASKAVGPTQMVTAADLLIGHHYASDAFTFQGTLDAVQVYSIALDAADIQALYDRYTTPPVPSSRIAYWPFDAGTGCTATEAENAQDGTLGPDCPGIGPAWATGIAGAALAFDGVQNQVTVEASPTLNALEHLTMAAWIQHGPPDNFRAILDKRDAAADGFDLYLDPDARLFMRLNQATLATDRVVGDGAWHHVAGTYDGTMMRLYVDGVLEAEKAATVGSLATDAPLHIGYHYRPDDRYAFDGRIDEVQLFDEALSADAIAALLTPGPDLSADLVAISRNPLYIGEVATVEAVLSAVLPGSAFTEVSATLQLDPALQLLPNTFAVTACPGGTCTFDEATQTLAYTGSLVQGQSVRVTFAVEAVAAQVGATVQWAATTVTPAESASAQLPNSDTETLDTAAPGAALAYYVDAVAGDDANPGTAAAPFRTLQRCVDLWDGEHRYGCYGQGVFSEEVLIRHGGPGPARRNQLLPWDTDGDGDLTDETFVLDGLGQQNKGLITAFPTKPKNVEVGYLTIRNLQPDGGCGDDADLIAIHMKCSGGEGCANWWIHHNTLEDIGPSCNAASHYIAVQPSNTPNLLFEHNTLTRVGGFMMRYFAGDNITIRDNHFEIHATGLKAWGEYQDSLKVIDNVFLCDGNGYNHPADEAAKCGGQTAVNFANNIQHGVIRGNTFENCVLPINIGADHRAGYRDNAHHVVENNFIRQTDQVCTNNANAIAIDDVAEGSVLNDGAALQVKDVLFRNNVMIFDHPVAEASTGAAIVLRAAHRFPFTSDLRFYHNTIQGYRWGILPAVGADTTGPYPYQLNGVDFQNNLFSQIHDRQVNTHDFDKRSLPPPAGWQMNHNTYSGADAFRWAGTSYTLAAWQALGQDGASAFCAPSFADAALRLAADDTCARDAGTPLVEAPTDRDGDARTHGAAPDAGADEFVAASKGDVAAAPAPPQTFALAANYPNPFNPRTVIRYHLPEATQVRLDVVDVLGRTVAVLVDEPQAAGRYAQVFEARALASGPYFYRLTAGAFTQTRMMLLLR